MRSEALRSPRLSLHDKFGHEHLHVRRDALALAGVLEALGDAQDAPAVVLRRVVFLLARVDYVDHAVLEHLT